MNRMWIWLVIVGAVVLTGCASTEPIWFIATPGYVDSRIAVSEDSVRAEYEAEIARLETELAEQRRVSDELADLAGIIEEVEQNNRELRDLAIAVEQRLEGLPRETVELLARILSDYLSDSRGE